MHSTGRWADWTVKDNMVRSLFFCASLSSRRFAEWRVHRKIQRFENQFQLTTGLSPTPGGCQSSAWSFENGVDWAIRRQHSEIFIRHRKGFDWSVKMLWDIHAFASTLDKCFLVFVQHTAVNQHSHTWHKPRTALDLRFWMNTSRTNYNPKINDAGAKDLMTNSCNFTPQVKEARNQSQIFNRKSISRNTTRRQSYHLQAMLTGVKLWKANTRSEKVNNVKTAMKKNAQTQPWQIKQNQNV